MGYSPECKMQHLWGKSAIKKNGFAHWAYSKISTTEKKIACLSKKLARPNNIEVSLLCQNTMTTTQFTFCCSLLIACG